MGGKEKWKIIQKKSFQIIVKFIELSYTKKQLHKSI